MVFYLRFFMLTLSKMLRSYQCTVLCMLDKWLRKWLRNCLPTFLNVFEISSKSCWQHKHLISEHLNTSAVLFVNKKFVKTIFRFGGCRFAWTSPMFLKPLTLFSTSVFTPDFIKSNIFELFGWKVLLKVKLLLFSVVLGWRNSVWEIFNAFCIPISATFSG